MARYKLIDWLIEWLVCCADRAVTTTFNTQTFSTPCGWYQLRFSRSATATLFQTRTAAVLSPSALESWYVPPVALPTTYARIVTNLLSCALEPYLLTYLLTYGQCLLLQSATNLLQPIRASISCLGPEGHSYELLRCRHMHKKCFVHDACSNTFSSAGLKI